MFTEELRAEIEIDADPDGVWAVLMDFEAYRIGTRSSRPCREIRAWEPSSGLVCIPRVLAASR